jgi:hypothetical protein
MIGNPELHQRVNRPRCDVSERQPHHVRMSIRGIHGARVSSLATAASSDAPLRALLECGDVS